MAITVETLSIDIDCDAITDGDACNADRCLARAGPMRGRRNTSARSSLARMEIRPFIDRIRLTHRSTLSNETTRFAMRAEPDGRHRGNNVYIAGIYRHSDGSVHTAPLYARDADKKN